MSSGEDQTISPMLRAERQLENPSSRNGSPNKHRGRHHHSDKHRHHTASSAKHNQSPDHKSVSQTSDLSNQLSPQPLSDATQSSDNSSRDYPKHHHKSSSRKSAAYRRSATDHRAASSTEQSPAGQSFTKDDLISAYSPIVDRQRHSSSASSSGPAIRTTASPNRQSIDRPYGFHHVGASVSPVKRTQQWAVLSPFSRAIESRDKNLTTSSSMSVKKNLNFVLSKNPTPSPQKAPL